MDDFDNTVCINVWNKPRRHHGTEGGYASMSPVHAPSLVILSLIMAFQGSYLGLPLARKIGASYGAHRRLLITISALSMALAIWTMHFVGMLALRLPAAFVFLVFPFLLSFLICVLVVGLAVFVASNGPPTLAWIVFASILMGIGIVSMHYVGMFALHTSIRMTHEPAFVVASVIVGIAASMIALWLGFVPSSWGSTFSASILMALAIAAMHYTAMAGLRVIGRCVTGQPSAPILSQEVFAIVVSVIAFVVSAMFLLTLVPEVRKADDSQHPGDKTPSAALPPPQGGVDLSASTHMAATSDKNLPIEKNGRRRAMSMNRIVAVQAQAHYTLIFDGEAEWFCPLAISDVESMLDPSLFARVHRSHIVNLDRVAFASRGGETGAVETTTPVAYKVPVSRSRRTWLKKLLQERSISDFKNQPE